MRAAYRCNLKRAATSNRIGAGHALQRRDTRHFGADVDFRPPIDKLGRAVIQYQIVFVERFGRRN
jgi:hypothetical protein